MLDVKVKWTSASYRHQLAILNQTAHRVRGCGPNNGDCFADSIGLCTGILATADLSRDIDSPAGSGPDSVACRVQTDNDRRLIVSRLSAHVLLPTEMRPMYGTSISRESVMLRERGAPYEVAKTLVCSLKIDPGAMRSWRHGKHRQLSWHPDQCLRELTNRRSR